MWYKKKKGPRPASGYRIAMRRMWRPIAAAAFDLTLAPPCGDLALPSGRIGRRSCLISARSLQGRRAPHSSTMPDAETRRITSCALTQHA